MKLRCLSSWEGLGDYLCLEGSEVNGTRKAQKIEVKAYGYCLHPFPYGGTANKAAVMSHLLEPEIAVERLWVQTAHGPRDYDIAHRVPSASTSGDSHHAVRLKHCSVYSSHTHKNTEYFANRNRLTDNNKLESIVVSPLVDIRQLIVARTVLSTSHRISSIGE